MGSIEDIERLSERKDLKVLFILIDTLRADRLSAWGYARETSPTIDWLASGGVRFARQLSQSSWTKCSMASLWTSLYPQRTGVLRFDHVLSSEAKLPAEILREAGFRTVGLFRNGWVAPNFGFSQGFEVYHQPAPVPLAPNERRQNPSLRDPASDTSAVEAFRSFLRVSAHERWFVYLHLMDVHQYTYDENSALFGTAISDIYDNSIRREDGMVSAIVSHLAEAGVLDQTLIVLAADHGEAFGERGFEGHARNVFQEVTEVPFVISFPFRLEPGLVIDTRTENVDIWPTLLDLLGLPPLEPSDGVSLVPLILAAARGEPLPQDGANAFAHIDQTWGQEQERPPAPMVAVASDGFRYVFGSRRRGAAGGALRSPQRPGRDDRRAGTASRGDGAPARSGSRIPGAASRRGRRDLETWSWTKCRGTSCARSAMRSRERDSEADRDRHAVGARLADQVLERLEGDRGIGHVGLVDLVREVPYPARDLDRGVRKEVRSPQVVEADRRAARSNTPAARTFPKNGLSVMPCPSRRVEEDVVGPVDVVAQRRRSPAPQIEAETPRCR